jgi:hypothetical protein
LSIQGKWNARCLQGTSVASVPEVSLNSANCVLHTQHKGQWPAARSPQVPPPRTRLACNYTWVPCNCPSPTLLQVDSWNPLRHQGHTHIFVLVLFQRLVFWNSCYPIFIHVFIRGEVGCIYTCWLALWISSVNFLQTYLDVCNGLNFLPSTSIIPVSQPP